ncbi:hypothetical protein SAY87_012473 [Trapa incisa]|uniref:TPM domain-containing protein n=1 Tax=Trapa incisa TaxID=236973 RepID=A0AAN7GKZ3_9MYRT|nr:hypothetical protein SAY87_012473 [Trapa incisa]
METILSSGSLSLLSPLISSKPSLPRSQTLFLAKPSICSLRRRDFEPKKLSLAEPRNWFSHAQQGLAALALTLALNLCPVLPDSPAFASEFDVLNDGPPKESYVVDDAGVLSRVTKSDLKRLLSDLESRKNFHINFVTVRKLTSKADAFEYADQVLERWYPTLEEGSNKGIVVLITSQKEGAVTGGPDFIKAVGDTILDATVSENLPVLATEEKYNEAVYSSAKRLVAAVDGLPDPGGPKLNDNKRESNFKTREETEEKRGQFSLVVGADWSKNHPIEARKPDDSTASFGSAIGSTKPSALRSGRLPKQSDEEEEMHSFSYRANSLLTFAATILAMMCAIASFSDNFNSPTPSAQVQVLNINWFQKQQDGNDEISLWDGIIPAKEHAKFWIHTSNKYQLVDQGSNFRGKDFNLTLH